MLVIEFVFLGEPSGLYSWDLVFWGGAIIRFKGQLSEVMVPHSVTVDLNH